MIVPGDYGPNFTKWDALLKQSAGASAIDWKLLKAICMIESSLGLNPRVECGLKDPNDVEGSKSTDGLSWGLFQLRPSTAKDFDPEATAEKLNDPLYSSKIAAKLLRHLWVFFSGNQELVVRGYNAGASGARNNPKIAQDYLDKFNTMMGVLEIGTTKDS